MTASDTSSGSCSHRTTRSLQRRRVRRSRRADRAERPRHDRRVRRALARRPGAGRAARRAGGTLPLASLGRRPRPGDVEVLVHRAQPARCGSSPTGDPYPDQLGADGAPRRRPARDLGVPGSAGRAPAGRPSPGSARTSSSVLRGAAGRGGGARSSSARRASPPTTSRSSTTSTSRRGRVAEGLGLAFARTDSLNDEPRVAAALARRVLAADTATSPTGRAGRQRGAE